jgi:hypothetical protein
MPNVVPPKPVKGHELQEGKATNIGALFMFVPKDEYGPVWLREGRRTVVGPTPAAVRAIAHEAEFQWKLQGERWAVEAPPTPRDFMIGWKPEEPFGGSSEFTFAKNKLVHAVVRLRGPLELCLDDQLPHAITRAVLAEHFGEVIPRWAGEGAASMAETPAAQARYDQRCRKLLEAGQGLRFASLFNLTEYPKDRDAFTAQAHSVTRFLLTQPIAVRAPRSFPRQMFLRFVLDGTKSGWNQAAREVYGQRDEMVNVNVLEEAWIAWLKTPESRLAPDQPRAIKPPKRVESERIPPVKLSATEEPDRIGRITIIGNKLTTDQVILDKLGLAAGRILQYPKLQAAKENLERLGLFTDVDVHVVPSDLGSPHVNIEVRVREKQPNGKR